MNRYSRTCAAVALALGTLPVAGLLHAAVDTPPTTPATISANRYSTTGADVIWARSTDREGLVRGYEVFRDGVSLGIRDALSVSEKALTPGKSYSYSVAAVDSAGQRSAPIRITLNTKGFTNAASAPGIVSPTVPVPVKPPTNPVPTAPTAGAPAAPTGLTSSAYSGTAGAIAWARPAAAGLRYDVRRDGTLVASAVDRLSYVDRALSAGREYRYEVVAIDSAGKRSAPTTVTLRTQGTATGSNPFTPVTPTAPTAPTTSTAPVSGLRGSIYSATTGEIFWQRSATPGLRYEISRDGRVLEPTRDGTSYYDSALPGGASVVYSVVVIDRDGRRSAPATVTLTKAGTVTPAPSTPTTPAPTQQAENPANIRALVYSSTTVELFYDYRPGTYDVLRRDGTIVNLGGPTRNFVDRSLVGGRTYVYELSRSTATGKQLSRITVTTPQSSSGVLVPPALLSARTDTAFQATLSWEASRGSDVVYVVYPGMFGENPGTELGTTQGTTFTVPEPVAGFGGGFSVVAVDGAGRRSVESVIFVPGPVFNP